MKDSVIYGIHAVSLRLKKQPASCRELLVTEKRNQRLESVYQLARQKGIGIQLEERAELTSRCGSEKHQGCVLLLSAESKPTVDLESLLESTHPGTLLLVLDGVQDPHNLGACLRTADACGVDAVIIPRDKSVGMNATVEKVAAGAAQTVPLIEVTNLTRALQAIKDRGIWVYGTTGETDNSLYDQDYAGPIALVMGNEGRGIRRLTAESCDYLVSIPMLGSVESLNVSVATGVCLYEINRSRMACGQG